MPRNKPQPRPANSFTGDELTAMKYCVDYALQQKPLPIAVIRSEGFRGFARKTATMQNTHARMMLELEKLAVPVARAENLQGGDDAGQDGARDEDRRPQAG